MVKKSILELAIGVWIGLTMTGCQSSDSGSGSRLMARQSSSPLNQPVTGAVYNPSGNKGMGISNSANPSTSMSAGNGVQQASAMQNGSVSSTGVGPASSTSSTPTFDQGGQVV